MAQTALPRNLCATDHMGCMLCAVDHMGCMLCVALTAWVECRRTGRMCSGSLFQTLCATGCVLCHGAAQKHRKDVQWATLLDVDEYLFVAQDTQRGFLRRLVERQPEDISQVHPGSTQLSWCLGGESTVLPVPGRFLH